MLDTDGVQTEDWSSKLVRLEPTFDDEGYSLGRDLVFDVQRLVFSRDSDARPRMVSELALLSVLGVLRSIVFVNPSRLLDGADWSGAMARAP